MDKIFIKLFNISIFCQESTTVRYYVYKYYYFSRIVLNLHGPIDKKLTDGRKILTDNQTSCGGKSQMDQNQSIISQSINKR